MTIPLQQCNIGPMRRRKLVPRSCLCRVTLLLHNGSMTAQCRPAEYGEHGQVDMKLKWSAASLAPPRRTGSRCRAADMLVIDNETSKPTRSVAYILPNAAFCIEYVREMQASANYRESTERTKSTPVCIESSFIFRSLSS